MAKAANVFARVDASLKEQADIIEIVRYIGQTLQEPRTAGNLYRPRLDGGAGILDLQRVSPS